MTEYSIEAKNLTKKFDKFIAVDNISFSVIRGDIFGFLGANGSGKSTTIRMLCGLLVPTDGWATVAGYNIKKEAEKLKSHIGYMSQKFSLYDDLTIEENIKFYGGVYGLSNSQLLKRLSYVLEMANLNGLEKSLTKQLPGGLKQRLALGCAVLHEPEIVFLDEPTGGVDPVARRVFWELINTLSENGTTVFVTTHYLDEAEYCNNIVFLDAGKIIAMGSPHELKTKYIKFPMIEVECDNVIEAISVLDGKGEIIETSVFGTYLHVNVEDEEKGRNFIHKSLTERGINVSRMDRIVPSLEDVFINLIEKKSKK